MYWDVKNLTQGANGTVLHLLFYILQEHKLIKTRLVGLNYGSIYIFQENETRFMLTFSNFVFAKGQYNCNLDFFFCAKMNKWFEFFLVHTVPFFTYHFFFHFARTKKKKEEKKAFGRVQSSISLENETHLIPSLFR